MKVEKPNLMTRPYTQHIRATPAAVALALTLLAATAAFGAGAAGTTKVPGQHEPLQATEITVQGLRRTVRLYEPASLADQPSLIIALHGSGGDGERLRRLTGGAFDAVAERHGVVVAYPDALGKQWNDCRRLAPYHRTLAGVDDIRFLAEVVRHATEKVGRPFAGVFVVGYSNGGHLVFRLALETPGQFTALAAIGAHLPIADERACTSSGVPVPMMLVSGTADPLNPWSGGEITTVDGVTLGHILSAEATARYFIRLNNAASEPTVIRHPDNDPDDSTTVTTRRWCSDNRNCVRMMMVDGGGHTMPSPAAHFPARLVGPTSRDIDGAEAIWGFFAEHLRLPTENHQQTMSGNTGSGARHDQARR